MYVHVVVHAYILGPMGRQLRLQWSPKINKGIYVTLNADFGNKLSLSAFVLFLIYLRMGNDTMHASSLIDHW